MKIFLDSANLPAIRKFSDMGVLDGVTTNPTLIAKEGMEFRELIDEITSIVKGPVSVEVIATKYEEMLDEARDCAKMAPNIVVKIPMLPEGLKAVKTLSNEGIKINVTLIFSANQGLLAAKAGATFVSPFIGRLDDIGHTGMKIISDLVQIYRNYKLPAEVLVASVRHPLHVIQAAKLGAHIATVPPDVLEKMLSHPLTDIGLKRFLDDWEKARPKIKPAIST